MKNRFQAAILFSLTFATAAPMATAQVIISHFGSTDPATEGWTAIGSGATVGPVDDGGTPAWFSNDTSTADGSFTFYNRSLSPAESALTASGWTLSANLRVTAVSTTSTGSAFIGFTTEARAHELFLRGTSTGNVEAFIFGFGPVFTLTDGLGEYHTYSLTGSSNVSTATLFVDGIQRAVFEPPTLIGPASVLWGTGASSFDGSANFNSVQFSIVPEPGATTLLMGGLAAAATFRRRKI